MPVLRYSSGELRNMEIDIGFSNRRAAICYLSNAILSGSGVVIVELLLLTVEGNRMWLRGH